MRVALAALAGLVAIGTVGACESRVKLTDETRGPQSLSATAERSQVRLTWSPVEGASGYEVYQGLEPGVSPALYTRLLHASNAELAVQQVIPGTVYHFVVTAIVGEEETDPSGEVSAAALEDSPIATVPSSTHTGVAGSRFGAAISSARDVDHDGRGDLVVGSPATATTAGVLGSIDVFLGSQSGVVGQPVFTILGKQTDAGFGVFVLGIPDVDQDGFDDVIVGEPHAFFESGRIYAYRGRGDGPLGVADDVCFPGGIECAFLYPGDIDTNLGLAAVAFPDLTGDGQTDLLVSSTFLASDTRGGLVELYRTIAPYGPEYPAVWSYQSPDGGDRLGLALAGARDVTGDGVPDAIAGAPGRAGDTGRVTLFAGSAGHLTLAWSADGSEAGELFGRHVAVADLDCDGLADVVAGAPGYSNGRGRVQVFRGGTPPLQPLGIELRGSQDGEALGNVAAIGDIDGDGCDDLLVGSPGFAGIFPAEGRAQIFRGGQGGLSAEPIWSDFGRSPAARFGDAVTGAGDVDGDSFLDIAVGAPEFEGKGLVAVYRGLAPTGPRVSAGLATRATAGEPSSPQLAGFSDPTAGQPFRCTWSWGDGEEDTVLEACTPATAGNVIHTWAEPGSYVVRLTVTRLDGVFGTAVTMRQVDP